MTDPYEIAVLTSEWIAAKREYEAHAMRNQPADLREAEVALIAYFQAKARMNDAKHRLDRAVSAQP